jgi:hypothetical protein
MLCVLAALLLVVGCSRDEPIVAPDEHGLNADPAQRPLAFVQGGGGLAPGGYYSCFWSDERFAYSELSGINVHTGRATLAWSIEVEPYPGQDPDAYGPMTFGITFDVDGTMYCTMNLISFDPSLVQSQLARLDAVTQTVTFIGDPVPFNTAGSDIDACGNMYVCGFQVDALGYIWGNSNLWRVDKSTGEFHLIGDTGHTNWMDLAFDSEGTLWGTFDNQLYTIDTTTGASTLVTDIYGVPDSGAPHWMEVMSIAFDARDQLYGTGLTVHYDHPDGSPVMKIDTETGVATLLGYSHTQYANHGGDILPSTVRICHRTGNGRYVPLTVSLSALPAHRAHGDIVPGVDTADCGCPGSAVGSN